MDEVRKDIRWLQSLGFELVNTVWEAGIPDLAPIQSSRDLRFRYISEPLRPARICWACTIQDSSAPVISEIRVVGAREVSAQSIIVASQLEIGAPATDSALRNAKLNLLSTGLFGMRKRDPAEGVTVAMRVQKGEAVITMEVDENPVIRGFDIAGSGPIPQREILKVLKPLQGAVARTSQLLRVTRDIRQMLEDRGYQGFVTEGLTVRDNTLLVPILISVIRDVEFRGIDPWLAALIQSGLRTHPGGYYNVNYLKRDLTWILQLGFKNVEPSFAFLTPGEVRISLATQPR
jgi:outer membrane protein assembly factor BamA